jgi:two-component system, NtrC family, sensor kinase
MHCPRCQRETRPQARFCEECGIPFKRVSPPPVSCTDQKSEAESLRLALAEALEQQTATAEILRVIATSQTDLEPVLNGVVESASRLSRSTDAWLHIREGEHLRVVAAVGIVQHPVQIGDVIPISAKRFVSRAFLERRTIHVPDTSDPTLRAANPEMNFPRAISVLLIPLMRKDDALGVLFVARGRAHPYSLGEIALVETFADQAVIAIENVRLLTELQRKNRRSRRRMPR